MKKRVLMNLHLFDDGGEGGTGGGQGGSAGAGDGGQGGNAGYTYEQLEEIANARASKAERVAIADYLRKKGMSEEDITTAIDDFKEKKKNSQPDVSAIKKERDDAIAERDSLKNTNILRDKGVKPEDIDYVLFKVGKLVDDKTDFSKAADKFLKENPRYGSKSGSYRVSTSSEGGSNGSGENVNNSINDSIRAAIRR
jgi:hypothetical protein